MTGTLYRDRIMEHYRDPDNRGVIEDPDLEIEVSNPNCGDRLQLTARLSDGRLEELRFEGEGCALSIASASILTGELEGSKAGEDVDGDELFEDMGLDRDDVSPMRRKCVELPLEGYERMVKEG
ncbi:MAG: iron-sulfur cluster assembly scaffold protein [Candidatus Nanohaloarchaea archaeon]